MTNLIHNHPLNESCEGCPVDRYVDGEHVFTDQTVFTYPESSPETKCDTCGEENLDEMCCPNSHHKTCVDCCPCHAE